MGNTTKDWVTVKVPKTEREKAKEYRPDGVTWGDCLVAGAERLNENLDSEIDIANPQSESAPDHLTALSVDQLHETVDELVDELGVVAGGEKVDDSKLAREVVSQFDYAELANRTADELEGRMR